MKKGKKAQLTLFIIIGIVIIGLIGGIFLIKDNFIKPQYDEKASVLKENLLDCFQSYDKLVLELNSYQGGYYEKPGKIYENNNIFLPYYYYEGKSYFPTIKDLETELAYGSKRTIGYCVDYYFETDSTYELSYDDFETKVKINKDEVIFSTDVKLNAKYDNKTVEIDFSDSDIVIESQLMDIFELSEIIVNQALNDEYEWIDVSEIHEEATKRNLNVTIIDTVENEKDYLFVIEANKRETYPTKFNFLNKYNLFDIGFPQHLAE